GRNTKEYEGHLYSVISGTFEVSETREININDVLHVEGNVDYSTGNITFGKDVIIEGVVKDGFKVAVGGSLYCKSNLDASDVICRKDLIAEQGIIGRGLAIIRVGGKLETKFIENCHVESQTGIKVEKNIMNSQIFTLGHLNLGEKGSIVSSHIFSELGVTAHSIGKPGSPSSEISIGFSFIEKRSLESTIQRVDVLKEKFRKLNNIPDYRKTDSKLKLLEQIEAVVKKGEEEIDLKRKNLYHFPDVTVNVTGTIYSGNIITICGVSHSVTSDISRIKFFLDKETHRIETTPLV
ncbi:MAG: DUF342 domain-containing protein, partial [Spirochaetales bacterium]|nr:DUF342 domain-containing protein [Spirochaetales bacterium]